ncbi:hypothetical protein [uncultured Croceitalea sp.]|uniref:hypothetical protein n=1 Tax=uncultured Croceitalea sp. TaxID=1798908 RepID=UPI00330658B2
MLKHCSILLVGLLLVFSCSNDQEEDESQMTIDFEFSDSFETSNDNLDELFPSNGLRWTGTQIVNPENVENELSLSSEFSSEGNKSLKILSRKSDRRLSKADIEKSGLFAPENSVVTIKADFYIDSEENIENLLLIDLECRSCWDPSVPDNQSPGLRLMMSGGNDYLSIERGKIGADLLAQTNVRFPRKEWVSITWESFLSPEENGGNKLLVNDQLVLSQNGMNLPNTMVFKNLFSQEGISFELQTPVLYERVQIGATANPDAGDILLYVDNVSITIKKEN